MWKYCINLAVKETSLVLRKNWEEEWVRAAFGGIQIDCSSKRREQRSDMCQEEESSSLCTDD